MENHVAEIQMIDTLGNFLDPGPSPGLSSGPNLNTGLGASPVPVPGPSLCFSSGPGLQLSSQTELSPEDQPLTTIDSHALHTAPAPEEEEENEEEEEEEEDEEEEKGLNEFQRKMKKEHYQALKNANRGCVVLERHRRKRITQSCIRLRQLLPPIPGGRIDMVTVLEMTVAFLEMVQQIVPAQGSNIQLCPPVERHALWLLQSQATRELGQKMSAKLEKE